MRFPNKVAGLGLAVLPAVTTVVAGHYHNNHKQNLGRNQRHLPVIKLAARFDNIDDRTDQTVTVTDNTRSEPTTIPEIVVFVDQNGAPVSTALASIAIVPPDSGSGALPRSSSLRAGALEAQVADTAVNDATGSGLFGAAYAPYNADGSCKTGDQITQDFGVIGQTYGFVRVYGVDCDQVPHVYAAAKANKLKVMFGIFSLDGLGDQIATLVQGIQQDWSLVDTVSIGNELVNNGQASPQQVIDALTSGRNLLRQSGWTGPVVTVDTFVAVLAHPELCRASDYCACNIHPFFDPNTAAEQAGLFVATQVQNIRRKLGNPSARVRVTESGWPWQGSTNGQAIPGADQQADALRSIRAAFADGPEEVVLFSAFNDLWKIAAPATFYAEQYWGIGTASAPSA